MKKALIITSLIILLILIIGGIKMSDKLYGICENKCLKEVRAKDETYSIEEIEEGLKTKVDRINVYGGDMDNLNYSCMGYAGSGATNKPYNTNGFFCVNAEYLDTEYITQDYTTSAGVKYFRSKVNGVWTNWEKLATEKELEEKSDTSHTHDGRYYTETEVNTKLAAKVDKTTNTATYNYTGTNGSVEYTFTRRDNIIFLEVVCTMKANSTLVELIPVTIPDWAKTSLYTKRPVIAANTVISGINSDGTYLKDLSLTFASLTRQSSSSYKLSVLSRNENNDAQNTRSVILTYPII